MHKQYRGEKRKTPTHTKATLLIASSSSHEYQSIIDPVHYLHKAKTFNFKNINTYISQKIKTLLKYHIISHHITFFFPD